MACHGRTRKKWAWILVSTNSVPLEKTCTRGPVLLPEMTKLTHTLKSAGRHMPDFAEHAEAAYHSCFLMPVTGLALANLSNY